MTVCPFTRTNKVAHDNGAFHYHFYKNDFSDNFLAFETVERENFPKSKPNKDLKEKNVSKGFNCFLTI